MTAQEFIDISDLDPAEVIAAIWNAINDQRQGWITLEPMTVEAARSWYEAAPIAGGSYPGMRNLDYVDLTAFKTFIDDTRIRGERGSLFDRVITDLRDRKEPGHIRSQHFAP